MAELNFQAGDRVKLRLALDKVEGIVVESSDSSIILLKLSSEYNIGISRGNIMTGRALKKFRESVKEKDSIIKKI